CNRPRANSCRVACPGIKSRARFSKVHGNTRENAEIVCAHVLQSTSTLIMRYTTYGRAHKNGRGGALTSSGGSRGGQDNQAHKAANSATGAVSARNTRLPRAKAEKPASKALSSSSSSNPPSGPVSKVSSLCAVRRWREKGSLPG